MSEILELRVAGRKEVTIKQKLLQEVVNTLDKKISTDNPQFYAEDYLLADNIRVEIDEVGELSFPLSEICTKKLVNVSTKVHFASGEQTLSKTIRNAHVIKSDKLRVSFNQQALDLMMKKFRVIFGFNDNCILLPHLHNMLIFGAGESLDEHRDSEKLENMIGLLVIVLPNAHIGGDLVIQFGDNRHLFSTEVIFPVKAKCFAFDAECSPEIKKVNAGHLIALVYKLILKTEELVVPPLVNKGLSEALEKYFDLKEDEQKLIYFLNHIYSKHSLEWNILKGVDHTNSLAMYSAAKQLGLIPHLALVKIKEKREVDEFLGDESLIYRHIALTFWVNSENKEVPFSKYYASQNDICFTRDTSEFEPYKLRIYKGIGRNYWYRRAAIVLWPETVKFSSNFSPFYNYFLECLIGLCQIPGNKRKVIDIVTQSEKCLCESYFVSTENKQKNILNLACIALYVENSETAFSLLSHSEWGALSSDFAEQLANLQFKYGVQWCVNLLNKMKTNSHNCLVNSFLLIRSFLENKVDTTVVKLLLDAQYELITNEISQNTRNSLEDLKSSLPGRIDRLSDFFKTCLICEDYITLSKMIRIIVSNIQQYPLTSLTNLYFELHENTKSEERMHFKKLRSYLTKTIDHKINLEMQSAYDWSINFQFPCGCENCAEATNFLQSKTEKTKVWPLREKLRNHIIEYFHSSCLPIKVSVRRAGSPYKLILVKRGAWQKGNISKKFDALKLCQQKLCSLKD